MNHPVLDFCLLIPCYNNYDGLIRSLKTVVYDPHRYLIVVVDDGSRDPLQQKQIGSALGEAKPIVVIANEKNRGITPSLNHGLAWIEQNTNTRYIARLDCGDTCSADRFYAQVSFLDQYEETGLLGSWCRFQEKESNKGYNYTTPLVHKEIKRGMYFRNLFIHPTVMFRAALLKKTGYYSEDFPHAEDYALFWRFISLADAHILPNFFVTCEINIKGISHKNRRAQLISRENVIKTMGKSPVLKTAGIIKLRLLNIVPKELILRLKKLRSSNV